MPIIIGIPLQLTIIGMPIAIIAFIALQRSAIASIPAASIGMHFIIMPSFVISQATRHIIGMAIIIGIIGMPPFIIVDGIIPPAIPIIDGAIIPPMGIAPGIGIGIGIIMGMPGIIIGMLGIAPGIPPAIGIWFIGIMERLSLASGVRACTNP
jgi:hypothetical protein